MPSAPHIHLRAETKSNEYRSPLSPEDAQKLLKAGFQVSVEKSVQRCFPIEEYRYVGCKTVETGSWMQADPDTYVLGIKELPLKPYNIRQKHIYFAHAYKQQAGWQTLLKRFHDGGGQIIDLEYLHAPDGKRLAAFGYWAGFVGTCLGVQNYCYQNVGNNLPDLRKCNWNRETILKETKDLLQEIYAIHNRRIIALVTGHLGRSGRGAQDALQALGITNIGWDKAETSDGRSMEAILDYDLLINCVHAGPSTKAFVTKEMLQDRKFHLSTIVDVSCDPNSLLNTLPIYSQITDLAKPSTRLSFPQQLDMIAIDHLPSLLPVESSVDFSKQLLPLLLRLKTDEYEWKNARNFFHFYRNKIL